MYICIYVYMYMYIYIYISGRGLETREPLTRITSVPSSNTTPTLDSRSRKGSTRAEHYVQGARFPSTKGRPRISRPGVSYCEFLPRETAGPLHLRRARGSVHTHMTVNINITIIITITINLNMCIHTYIHIYIYIYIQILGARGRSSRPRKRLAARWHEKTPRLCFVNSFSGTAFSTFSTELHVFPQNI